MVTPTRKPQASPPSPAEILDQVAALEAQEPELDRKLGEAAEESITSAEGQERYDAILAEKVALHQKTSRLRAALVGAEHRTKAEQEKARQAAEVAKRERFYKANDRLPPLARKMESKIVEFVQVFREYIKAADEAYAAYPNGPAPMGLGLSNTEILQQVSAELYRVGALAPITGRPQTERLPPNIPGAKCPNHLWLAQPELIPAFSVAVEQCVQAARKHVGEVQHGR